MVLEITGSEHRISCDLFLGLPGGVRSFAIRAGRSPLAAQNPSVEVLCQSAKLVIHKCEVGTCVSCVR